MEIENEEETGEEYHEAHWYEGKEDYRDERSSGWGLLIAYIALGIISLTFYFLYYQSKGWIWK